MAQSTTMPSLAPQVREFVSTPRHMLIEGSWVEVASGKTFPVYDPGTEEIVARVVEGEARTSIEPYGRRARLSTKDRGAWQVRYYPEIDGREAAEALQRVRIHVLRA